MKGRQPILVEKWADMTMTAAQQTIVDQIKALKKMTEATGFKTTRSKNDLLERLNADDLAAVAGALYSTN